MEIVVGDKGGFCFGVKRAVENATMLAKKHGKVFVLGDLIHNEFVNEKLKNFGVEKIESLDQISEGVLLIRAHGEGKEVLETAKRKGITLCDLTCPFVSKIHEIVRENHLKGKKIIILGDKRHPEVIGINGWCDNTARVYANGEDIVIEPNEQYVLVEQTTYSIEKFEKFLENIDKNILKTVEIFKTICYTTRERQNQVRSISMQCDAVLVLGGANSSNTERLFEICKDINDNTFRLYSPDDVSKIELKKYRKVGIVLGASTPREQFQEVISKMEENEVKTEITEIETTETVNAQVEEVPAKEEVAEVAEKKQPKKEKAPKLEGMAKAMADMERASKFRKGQVLKATISSATDEGLQLYVANTKKEILLKKDELIDAESYDKANYGDKLNTEIRVMVVNLNPVVLSEKAMKKIYEEDAKITELEDGREFSAEVTAFNKGGLSAKFESYDVFIPMSQIKRSFVKPEELEKYVGKTLRLRATEIKRGRRREIIASQRVILEEEYKQKEEERLAYEKAFFENTQINDIVSGTVVRFAPFGAIINVEGFDCLAHISDLSWVKCGSCADVLEIGKTYDFVVLKMDFEKKHASLGYKQLQPKPFDTYVAEHAVGDAVKGKVVRLVPFGAFVELAPGVDGLVHAMQITNQWVENPVSTLKVGDEVDVKIIDINSDKFKITLSIKALLQDAQNEAKDEAEEGGKKRGKKKEVASEETELKEWKEDQGDSGVSLADLLNSKEDKE